MCAFESTYDLTEAHLPSILQCTWGQSEFCADCCLPSLPSAAQSVPPTTMAYAPAPSPTVVDQTTLMKKYLQFVAALTDANTRKLNLLTVLLSRKNVICLF